MATHTLLAALLLFTSSNLSHASKNDTYTAKPIIIDTDIMTDCDDAGALAIANVFHNCKMCDLSAVMINTHSEYGALAASAINTYFGNGHIPIGSIRPLTNETFFDKRDWVLSDFASKLAHNWPRDLTETSQTQTPLELYRATLKKAQDNSVTLISIGFLNNLATLLDSPGGHELISSKVRELVIMGGRYPSGWEYNFGGFDPTSTAKVISNWPKSIPITYSGYELGKAVISGDKLADYAPADSPVLAAYQWYLGRCRTARESWDPVTVLYGIFGLDGMMDVESPFKYANDYGYNSITEVNGTNAWVNDSSVTNQHWLELAEGVTNTSVARMLTHLYAHDPSEPECLGWAVPPLYEEEAAQVVGGAY